MQSIRVFIDASSDKVAVVELRCFGYQCFVVWSRSEGITKARAAAWAGKGLGVEEYYFT